MFRLAFVTVKLFYRRNLKAVVNIFRSYHLKTLFYHFMDTQSILSTQDTEVDELIVVEEIVERFLKFVQAQLEKRECPHFFIDSVNLWKLHDDHSAAQEFDFCSQTIQNFLKKFNSSKTLVKNTFCPNSRMEMMILDMKKKSTRKIKVFVASLVFLNIASLVLGTMFYLAGFAFVITILICFVYASLIMVPVILLFAFIYFVAQFVKNHI